MKAQVGVIGGVLPGFVTVIHKDSVHRWNLWFPSWCIRQGTRGEGDGDADYNYLPLLLLPIICYCCVFQFDEMARHSKLDSQNMTIDTDDVDLLKQQVQLLDSANRFGVLVMLSTFQF